MLFRSLPQMALLSPFPVDLVSVGTSRSLHHLVVLVRERVHRHQKPHLTCPTRPSFLRAQVLAPELRHRASTHRHPSLTISRALRMARSPHPRASQRKAHLISHRGPAPKSSPLRFRIEARIRHRCLVTLTLVPAASQGREVFVGDREQVRGLTRQTSHTAKRYLTKRTRSRIRIPVRVPLPLADSLQK